MGRARDQKCFSSPEPQGTGQFIRLLLGRRGEGLIKFYVSHHSGFTGFGTEFLDPETILLRLHQEERDKFQTAFKEESKEVVTPKRLLRDSSVEENDGNPSLSTGAQKIGPEFGLRDEKEAGAKVVHRPSEDERMIHGNEEDGVGLRKVGFSGSLSRGGHGRHHDFPMGKLFLHSFQEGDRAEDLSHGGRMDPDRILKRKGSEGSHPLSESLEKSFLSDAAQKEVEKKRNQEKGEEGIIEEVDHLIIV